MYMLKTIGNSKKAFTLGILLAIVFAVTFHQISVLAGAGESARGFAWGGTSSVDGAYQGMGWISMNNISDGSGINYGVNIPAVDGDVTGYAWSGMDDTNGQPDAGYGWISFRGADLAGCAPALAQARRVGNTLTGGARILSIMAAMAVPGGNAGGYDGCIDLSGITIAGNALSGYAWSSDLGWIDFSGVTLSFLPQCSDGIDNEGDGFADFGAGPLHDPGCTDANDDDETDGGVAGPDLVVQSFNLSAGPYTIGTPITLTGVVRNNGTLVTPSGFSDNFTYSFTGPAGPWLPNPGPADSKFGASTNEVTNVALAPSTETTDIKTFTPDQNGSLYIQYCVDSKGEIPEGSGEGNNCRVSGEIIVGPGGSGVVCDPATINNCDLPSGNESDVVAGVCSVGYSGSCNATCLNNSGSGNWNVTSNTCTPNPVIDLFQICDSAGLNCTETKDVPAGTPLTVKWNALNADTCGRFGGPADFSTGPGNPTSGTDPITANALPGQTDNYEIICSKGATSVRDTATVRTAGPDITVDKRITNIGGIVRISWTTAGALGCTVTGGGINPPIDVDTYGVAFRDIAITAQTTFTLNCGALGTDTITVDITGWQAGT